MEDEEIPDGVAIFGTDGAADDNSMIYFDVRGVSREYRWSIDGGVWRWWRNSPDFSQRRTLTISADGQTLESSGEMSRAAEAWEPDLHMTYTRVA
jgi:hypothetical protein